MKTVVKNLPTDTVLISTVNNEMKYYGALLPRDEDDVKGYFRAQRYCTKYNLFSMNGFNDGNAFGYEAGTLAESIEKVLAKNSGNKVYEFDTLTELFTWLES